MMQETTQDVDLKDPMLFLPPEMLSQLLLCLPPSSIARSSAINKRWRAIINSDPSLHQEVDLPSFLEHHRKGIEGLLETFERLSSLSLNNLVNVSLNLTSLFSHFNNEVACGLQNSRFLERILETLQESSQTLKHLEISVNGEIYYSNQSIKFFAPLMKQLHSFHQLQTITIYAPFSFTLSAGDVGPGTRRFTLFDNTQRWGDGTEPDVGSKNLSHYAKKVTEIAASQLTGFRITEALYKMKPSKEGVLPKLYDDLLRSRDTLQILDLKRFGQIAEPSLWNLALSCPNLTEFSFGYEGLDEYVDEDDLESKRLRAPTGLVPTGVLKKFDFRMITEVDNLVDWDSGVIHWLGHQLEVLQVEQDFETSFKFMSSNSLSSIILNSQATLTVLHLTGIGDRDDFVPTVNASFSLPNLTDLQVKEVESSVYHLISGFNVPRLEIFILRQMEDYEIKINPAFNCFLSILKSSHLSLAEIKLNIYNYSPVQLLEPDLSLPFPDLVQMDLSTSDWSPQMPDHMFAFLSKLFICSKWVDFSSNFIQKAKLESRILPSNIQRPTR